MVKGTTKKNDVTVSNFQIQKIPARNTKTFVDMGHIDRSSD